MTCKRDKDGNITGWDRESLLADGFTPTGVILDRMCSFGEVRTLAVRLKTPVECLHAAKMADTGDWELFYEPGVTPGSGFTESPMLRKA